MKNMKKVLALVLALVMMVALGVTAFAAEIDVTNVRAGETYEYYKILNYDLVDGAYSYYLTVGENDDLKDLLVNCGFNFTTNGEGTKYIVTNAGDLSAAGIVEKLNENKTSLGSLALAKDSKEASANGEAVFSGLTTGYYFVTTTTGSLCSLASYDAKELVVDKHDAPSVTKTVDKANANVGDQVTYTLNITLQPGESIVLDDTLSAGLTLDAQSNLSVSGTTDYEVKTWDTTKDASKLQIAFGAVDEKTTVTVSYKATINDSALTQNSVTNEATLSYGNKQKTTPSKAETKLFSFEIDKVDADSGDALEGVEFQLTNGAGKYYDGTTVWTDTETTLTTDSDGKIAVNGLAAGTYTLTETKPLATYSNLSSPVTVIIAEDGTVTVTNADSEGNVVTIENISGAELPTTGGMGTTILYIVGLLLIVGAGACLVIR